MKFFYHIAFAALASLSIFFTLSQFSCSKDKCLNVACLNGGECDGGTCECKPGFEGSRCEVPSRNKLIGVFNGGDSCTVVGAQGYFVQFFVSLDNKTQFVLKNLLNDPDDSATCTMVKVDSFIFNGNNSAVTYSGTGKYSNDSLFLAYHVQYDTSNYDCKYFGIRY